MQQCLQYTFYINNEAQAEILIALLSEIGFDGFEEKENELLAYIDQFNINDDAVTEITKHHQINFFVTIIKEENWNALWESNFQPIIINDAVAVRAHFHQQIKNVKYDIIITPKMSFGTGHHATTYLMIEQLLKLNLNNKTVLDFGTGTGLLAILAEKLGAASVTAIDNDKWSINNATENIQQNNCYKIQLLLSDHPPLLPLFDVVLGNINKNVIMADFKNLYCILKPNGCIVLSGLLETDEQDVLNFVSGYNLKNIETNRRNKWLLFQFNKTV